ncbi:putative ABC transport system substrate-binding protein [Rhizobiales bacterium GAS113]|nr:putative ABC transport system substrate-binding protein [Rhizobiales bacterium GAS113]
MRRRELFTLIGSILAWPLTAHSQEPPVPVVGYVTAGTPEVSLNAVKAFLEGLGETGFVEGRNVTIEYRWARNDRARLPELVADLVNRHVAVIATPGSVPAAVEAKAATTTIPIVFSTAGDPVRLGIVTSFSRPGGNITGVASMNHELLAKRFELLVEAVPTVRRIAVLVNPNSTSAESTVSQAQRVAGESGRQIEVLYARTDGDIDAAFAVLPEKHVDALLVTPATLFLNRRVELAAYAARLALPAIYFERESAEAGGLMSYGPDELDQYRQAGVYTGRILKGEKPAELPVLRPEKFCLVINLRTAKSLGLTLPRITLSRADAVIE